MQAADENNCEGVKEEERSWEAMFGVPMLPDHVSGSYLRGFFCPMRRGMAVCHLERTFFLVVLAHQWAAPAGKGPAATVTGQGLAPIRGP